jgi:hypothetical protein
MLRSSHSVLDLTSRSPPVLSRSSATTQGACSLGSSEEGTTIPQGHEGVASHSRMKEMLTGDVTNQDRRWIEETIVHRGFVDRGGVYGGALSQCGRWISWEALVSLYKD